MVYDPCNLEWLPLQVLPIRHSVPLTCAIVAYEKVV